MVIRHRQDIPENIEIRGARANNLKNLDLDIPLNAFVAVTGVSGSGKSSLAMDTIYAEGARKYLAALSTYTRRRITQAKRADVRQIANLPATIALRQRPAMPSVRSTVGTMTESLNILRLMFSRLASVVCPNGHRLAPSLKIAQVMDLPTDDAAMGQLTCPTCGVKFTAFSAEDFAFNAEGACPTCQGTGFLKQIELQKIIPDKTLSIDDGAIRSWRLPGRTLQPAVARELGIRTDVPFKDLTAHEQELLIHGPGVKKVVVIPTSTGKSFTLNALYENAIAAVEHSLQSTKNENTLQRLSRFYSTQPCPTCHGSRFNPKLFTNHLLGKNIAEVCQLTIAELQKFCQQLIAQASPEMMALTKNLTRELLDLLAPITDLGLNYLTLTRSGNTLSTGERQRIQLARTIRNQMTGILYVLDEPSVGLHPANVTGLIRIFQQLIHLGNSLLVVDHDTRIIGAADEIIEIGPQSGAEGGQLLDQGTPAAIEQTAQSVIRPYLTGDAQIIQHQRQPAFTQGKLSIDVSQHFNLHHFHADFGLQRLNVVTGMSGSGKTTLVFDSLIPALEAQAAHEPLPSYVQAVDAAGIKEVVTVDASPIGKNVRSTVATYTKILDQIRHIFAQLPEAKAQHFTASDFSYNNTNGACPNCGGTGTITLDIQYLPDMAAVCPVCHGQRYRPEILKLTWRGKNLAEILNLSVSEALTFFKGETRITRILKNLVEMGLGYLELGESTPTLSGGEAQRLKLVTQIKRKQAGRLFVFDEPSVGLHPKDVAVLLQVFQKLLDQQATIIVIEHDLDIIANADYINDLGPEGGQLGGQLVATGTPQDICQVAASRTGQYLRAHLAQFGLPTK